MSDAKFRTLHWQGGPDGDLLLIDQTLLPLELKEIECKTVEQVWEAIRMLRVRGAPAIGIAAAYGVCVGVRPAIGDGEEAFYQKLTEVTDYLAQSRPTAVNLFWGLGRMKDRARSLKGKASPQEVFAALLAEAQTIEEEDRAMCRAIGRHGAALLSDGMGVLTHCNAGGLATADYGTALAVIFAAHEEGKRLHVYCDETRPLLQGARLTSWELQQWGIETTLICDSVAAHVMQQGRVQAVITGADRIAANGDAANKIGTYGVALSAQAHGIPFFVAAPSSTFDLSVPRGNQIPIEERDPREVTHGFGRQTAPTGVNVYNPAFDVTPARLIQALICERGIIEPVNQERIAEVLSGDATMAPIV